MNNPALVYLAGPISGLTYGECTEWREYVTKAFPPHIQGVSPLRAKRFLEGKGKIEQSYSDSPFSTDHGITTRDKFDVLRSSVILVNLLGATERVSIGTMFEIAWASDHGIPIVCAIEPDRMNVHDYPMVRDTVDFRMSSLDEAIEAVVTIVSPHEKFIWTNLAGIHVLQEAGRLDLTSEPTHDLSAGYQAPAN